MDLQQKIFSVDEQTFTEVALQVFHYQYENNEVYRSFVTCLGVDTRNVNGIEQIPFLPISFFKTKKVISSNNSIKQIFESSGTTGSVNSKHYLTDIVLYEQSLLKCFENIYGREEEYCFLALLPNYLERKHSSLIYMVDLLMKKSSHSLNNYYLYDHKALYKALQKVEEERQPTILFGVSFALLDFAEKYDLQLKYTKIIETGGMKGRRKEITREEMHRILCDAFGTQEIHSEYGMTELLSQAYSTGEGKYQSPPWMRVMIREVNDPFSYAKIGATGGINVIDLANLYSCAFIETQDLGKAYSDGTFSILGRFDTSDIRGCNLMVE